MPANGRSNSPPARARKRGGSRLRAYLLLHAQVLVSTLGRLSRTPGSSLMTVAVIGIALALPSGLLTLLDNLQRLNAGWDSGASISLFLKNHVSDTAALNLAERLQQWPTVESVDAMSREQALEEFRALSGFGEALDALDDNPLPALLILQPASGHKDATAAQALIEELQRLPETDLAQLDLQWVKRFAALMEIGRRGVLVVGALLALAALLIIGNTIRLEIQNRREEIEVTKLIGGTDGFIRRPFLYTGLWYGFGGALLAWLLVELSFWQMSEPVRHLAGLYQSEFLLRSLTLGGIGTLLGSGIALGLAGSWLAVGRHLGRIEPAS